ncbi:hypothetical protein BDV06DRAFT_229218 [Aspergillus oleicola]
MAAKKTVQREHMILAGGGGFYDGEIWDAPSIFGPFNPPTPEPYGTGTMQYDDDSVYTGQWKDGVYWGRGRLTTKDEEYEGDWAHGKKQGQGKLISKSEGTYEGWWDNDKRSGNGVQTWRNGATLRGKWTNDKPTGNCTITWPESSAKYYGHVNDYGYPDGQGKQTYKNGSYYDGDWRDGEHYGNGVYYNNEKRKIYKGSWTAGKMNGTFRVTFLDSDKNEKRKYSNGVRTD